MTPDELRRIDAMVAEKVMGWRLDPASLNYVDHWWLTPEGGRWRENAAEPRLRWSPSTSWDAAGQVVERLRRQGRFLHVNDALTQYRAVFFVLADTEDWTAFCTNPTDARWDWADIVPLAISRAALKAVGVDVAAAV